MCLIDQLTITVENLKTNYSNFPYLVHTSLRKIKVVTESVIFIMKIFIPRECFELIDICHKLIIPLCDDVNGFFVSDCETRLLCHLLTFADEM